MENTLASLNAAAEAGLRWVEIDVGETADGVVVVGHFHARLYEDCAGVRLGVASATRYAALAAQARTHGRPVPPRLDDVLARFRGRLGFQIERKQDADYPLAVRCHRAAAARGDRGGRRRAARATARDALVDGLAAALRRAALPRGGRPRLVLRGAAAGEPLAARRRRALLPRAQARGRAGRGRRRPRPDLPASPRPRAARRAPPGVRHARARGRAAGGGDRGRDRSARRRALLVAHQHHERGQR